MDHHIKKVTRRKFIDNTAKTAVGIIGYSLIKNAKAKNQNTTQNQSRVVVVTDENALTENNVIQNDAIQIMMDEGIQNLTGINNVGEAWLSLFPGITPDKVINIKVNCLFPLSSHPEVVYTIINGLTSMQVENRSFPEKNIIIWDRTNADLHNNGGYTINTGDTGVKVFGSNYSGAGYSSTSHTVADQSSRLSRILTEMSDYMINLCVMKNHSISGVTFSMKNHYGTCHNPGDLHGGHCNPYIPALNALPEIRDKQVVNICDALFAVRSGGPGGYPQITPKTFVLSRDPVALDYTCMNILSDLGMAAYSHTIADHITTAANDTYNLGTNDPAQIETVLIENPSIDAGLLEDQIHQPSTYKIFPNYPNPFNTRTTLSYQLNISEHVRIDILDTTGNLITTLTHGHQSSGYYRIQWNGKSKTNRIVPSGIYLAKIRIGQEINTLKIQLLK